MTASTMNSMKARSSFNADHIRQNNSVRTMSARCAPRRSRCVYLWCRGGWRSGLCRRSGTAPSDVTKAKQQISNKQHNHRASHAARCACLFDGQDLLSFGCARHHLRFGHDRQIQTGHQTVNTCTRTIHHRPNFSAATKASKRQTPNRQPHHKRCRFCCAHRPPALRSTSHHPMTRAHTHTLR